ncbi:MAG: PAS-domain containing protein [Alphaproteobacteria bacterium]
MEPGGLSGKPAPKTSASRAPWHENAWARTLIIALAYFGTGYIGQGLTIPGQNASFLWAPAGIAFGTACWFGIRAIPGITLGALILYLATTALSPKLQGVAETTLVVGGLIFGATIQPMVGAYLVRRFGQRDPGLNRRHVVAALLLVPPFICVIGSTLGNATLYAAGFLSGDDLVSSWKVWWLGDLLGIAVFTPLVFAIQSKARTTAFGLVAVILLGIGGTYATAVQIRDDTKQSWDDSFSREAGRLTSTFLHWLDLSQGPINALGLVAGRSVEMRKEEFFRAVDDLEQMQQDFLPYSIAVAMPSVDGDRAALIANLDRGDAQWPIHFSTDEATFATGANVAGGDEVDRAAVLRAALSDPGRSVIATFQVGQDGAGYSLFAHAAARGDSFAVVLGLISIDRMIDGLFAVQVPEGVALDLRIRGAASDPSVPAAGITYGATDPHKPPLRTNTVRSELGGASLEFHWKASARYLSGPGSDLADGILMAGVVATAAVCIFLAYLLGQNAKIRRMSKVFMEATDPIVIQDLYGRIIDFNREAEQAYGLSRSDMPGLSFATIVPDVWREEAEQIRQRCLAGEEVRNVEGVHVNEEGQPVDVLVTMFRLTDETGRPVAIASSAKDISSLKQTQAELTAARDELEERVAHRTRELAETEAQLRLTLDNMPGAILLADSDLRIVLANARYGVLYGHDSGNLIPGASIEALLRDESARGLIPPQGGRDQEEEIQERLASYRSQETSVFENRSVDGRIMQVTRTPAPGGYTVSVFIDITERRLVQERTQALLESAPDAMLAVDRQGRIVLANRQVQTVFGHSTADLIGQEIEILVPESVRDGHRGFVKHFVQSASVRQMGGDRDLFGLRADGSVFPIEVALSPVSVEGEDTLIVAAIRDVTDRVEAQNRLKLQMKELAEARERAEALREEVSIQKSILDSAVANMDQAITMFDADLRLSLFNERLFEVMDVPRTLGKIGTHISEFFRHNAERGDYGDVDIERAVAERVAQAAEFEAHAAQRVMPDGRTVEIKGNPVAAGGFVTTYTDITPILEAQRDSKLLKEAMDTFTDMVILYDRDERVIFTNDRYHEIYPLSPSKDDIRNHTMESLLRVSLEAGQIQAPLALSDPEAWIAKTLADRRREEGGFGETQHANGRTYFYRYGRTTEGGLILMQSDITERKRIEEQLRTTIDNIPAGIIMCDGEMNIRLYNDLFGELLDLPKELVEAGRSVTGIWRYQHQRGDYGDVDLEKQIGKMCDIFESRDVFEYERDIANGTTLEMRFSPMSDGGGVWIASDVTKRKEILQALQDSEQQLNRILEASPIAVAVSTDDNSDDDGLIEFTNARFRSMLEFDGEQHGIARTADFFSDEAQRSEYEHLLEAGEAVYDREALWTRSDGRDVWTLMSISPIHFNDRKSALVWLYDITERKAMEGDLLIAKEQAEAATKAKDSFLATMSHEIRTPMNGVVGMVDLLSQTQLDGDQRQMASTIRDSAFALLTIINDILDFSKIEAGKLEMENIPVSISNIVDGVAETMGPNVGKKNVRFHSYTDPAIPPRILGDQVRLRQILFNLLGNAIKFTEDGAVTMRADLVSRDGDRATVRYSVQDQGIGMTDAQVRELFKPFQQAEASTTRRFGGTGLGLSIVHRLVTMMKGQVTVESRPGAGSRFDVTLTHQIVADGAQEIIRDLDGIRVLSLTGQDEVQQLIVKDYLENHGAEVDLIFDPQDLADTARKAAQAGRPYDVVTLGFDIADDSKFELRQTFRDDDELKAMRFVVGRPTYGIGASIELPDTTIVPATPLTQRNLVNAVAVAVGRASPNIRYGSEAPILAVRDVPSVEAAEANRELILVVEDNKTNQDVIRRQLHRLGYQCEIAEDGKLGLAAIGTGRYSLVLTDVHMPNMDGFEMTARVRKSETDDGTRLPIVAITANALQGEADRCLANGMDDYLSKPLEMKKLQEMLRRWLPHVAAPTDAVAPSDEAPAPAESKEDGGGDPVDLTALADMFGDDMETITEILKDFVEPAWDIVGEIETAIQAGDAAGVGAAGHKLKSSSRAVGANDLADLCFALEKAGKSGDMETIETEVQKLRPTMMAVASFIDAI